jgi:hypothetical protein
MEINCRNLRFTRDKLFNLEVNHVDRKNKLLKFLSNVEKLENSFVQSKFSYKLKNSNLQITLKPHTI